MRSACIVMTVIFAQFSYFQKNDLDQFNTEIWYIWIAVYGLCSALSLLTYFTALPRKIYGLLSLTSLAGALVRLAGLTPGEDIFFNDHNPAGNEAGGLFVIALWFNILYWRHSSLEKSLNKPTP